MREIQPPNKLNYDKFTVFLAGSIEQGKAIDWQAKIKKELSDKDLIILNPRRDDWDTSLKQEITCKPFKEQVTWELDAQDNCDMIVMYFDKDTQSPITLLELGLYATSNRLVVCCPNGFWRKGNVDIVCERYKIKEVKNLDALIELIKVEYLNKYLNK